MDVPRQLHRLIDDAMAPHAATAVAAVRQLEDEHLPWLRRRAVTLARREGISWAGIGRMLGISRQAALKRYGAELAQAPAAPQVARHEAERLRIEYEQVLATAARDRRHRALSDEDDVVAW